MNPLKELNKSLPYSKMAPIVGLHENSLRRLGTMTSKELKGVTLGTYLTIKDKLGVDLTLAIK